LNIKGFTKVDAKILPQKRIIMSIDGLEKEGKTHFALSAPGDIAFFDFDIGTEGVIEKFADQREIYRASFQAPVVAGEAVAASVYEKLWNQFKQAYFTALSSAAIRTIIIDTATEAWELLRLFKFGRLDKVMPFQYGPVNAEYRDLVRMAYGFNKNLLLIHKKKPKYVNDKRTSAYERAGFGDTGFLVQCNTDVSRDEEGEFSIHIRDCRQNPEITGEDFPGPLCNFPMVMSSIFVDSALEEWE